MNVFSQMYPKAEKQSVQFDFSTENKQRVGKSDLQILGDKSSGVKQLRAYQQMADNFTSQSVIRANHTGLPNNLKTGIEQLSGLSMNDVKVHYNSDKPAQLRAHAYAQGTEIHLASGQEQHLPHEAWHVVQQKQGRVKPTMQLKGKVAINDDTSLEREADAMGAKVAEYQLTATTNLVGAANNNFTNDASVSQLVNTGQVMQMAWYDCILNCLPFLRRAPEAEPLLNERIGRRDENRERERHVELHFREYFNEEEDYQLLQSACIDADIGGVCTAMTIDWFAQIARGGDVGVNPVRIPSELQRLVREHTSYRGMAIKSRSGMNEYMATKGMSRAKVSDGHEDYLEGRINQDLNRGVIGEISDMDDVELQDGGMYMIDFTERGSEGIGHTIGLYKQPRGGIVVRDQNVGQQTVADMRELSQRYSRVFAGTAVERESNMTIPFYRAWALYRVS
ncbi:MAG: DUF4157 domain-containing protein [Fluviicola sp.]|nr:DUF4157 domain-containing protein [Fluviicola sp.]